MAENILVLEPGDERAQKIAKAMSSQTASDILHLLGEGQVSLNDLAEKLSIPINTAKYHVENLLDAGLVAVAETRYSVKGREVKMYSLTNQLLIVAPKQSPVRSLILKYASLFAILVIATLGVMAMAPLFAGFGVAGSATADTYALSAPAAVPLPTVTGDETRAAEKAVLATPPETTAAPAEDHRDASWNGQEVGGTGAAKAVSTAAMEPPVPLGAAPPATPDLALGFFLGGILVIFILLCYEAWLWKKHR
ncbi:MAG: helix-turn-helix domain-containing protein [Methanomicrobiales archaeon]|nr:helix-turn-helix domain-containing protein [Methanomicrobiales archaeon]